MAAPIWYLGPANDMRPLVCPEGDFDISVERYGGFFQGLSGARTATNTGQRQRFSFDLKYLDETEYAWIDAMQYRAVPGPYYLRNPFKKNMLSAPASLVRSINNTRIWNQGAGSALYLATGVGTRVLDWPTAAGTLGAEATSWSNRTGTAYARFDDGTMIPVELYNASTGAGRYTFSLYVKSSAAVNISMLVDLFDITRTQIFATTASSYVPVTSSWQRVTYTFDNTTVGSVLARPVIYVDNNTATVKLAAAQMEQGSTATSWTLGGANPQVILDQVTTNTPRWPYRSASLSVLEV